MKKIIALLFVIAFCLSVYPAAAAQFSETNTQEIGDEAFKACVAKGVIKGETPPKIIMKVRATCTEAYTALHEELKKLPDATPKPAPQKPEEKPKK